MSRIIRVVKINKRDECNHEELHIFPLPDFNEKGWYRQGKSFDAFFHHPVENKRTGKYAFRSNTNDVLYYSYRPDEWEFNLRSIERLKKLTNNEPRNGYMYDDELPQINHANIWEFYKHIGYDYNKRKWLTI